MGCPHRRFVKSGPGATNRENGMGVIPGFDRHDPPADAPVLRERASEIRRIAGDFDDMQARTELFQLADHWEGLARRLEIQASQS
jgi:hypothetical protein